MKTPKRIALLLIVVISNYLVAQDQDFSISKIPEELKINANSVVRIDDFVVEVNSQNSMTYKAKVATTVLNKLGDHNKYIQVSFDKNTKIKSIETYIYDAFGKEIKKVKNSEYQDVSAVDGGTLFGDSRMIYYRYTPISYPYTIYYEYEVESINTGFIPGWRPISSYLTSVESSSYTLKSKEGLKIRFKEKNFEGYVIEKETSDNKLSYEIANQTAIKKEPSSPLLRDFTPTLIAGLYKFSLEGINGEASNWSEFGKWQYDYLKAGNDKIHDDVKILVLNLVEGINDPIEKAKIIYKYVQDRTRYISVQVGIGGWMPIPANEVHRLGYGDCKGLANYTKTLLDAVGVESYYTVIWAGDENRNVEKDFFSMQGNHIILNLPTNDGNIWLECTSQKVPFGYLGDFTDDRDALVITPEGGVIKHTKVYDSKENLQVVKGEYEIDEKGTINASVKITSKGTQYIDNLQRNDGVSRDELIKLFKNHLSYLNNIKFSKIEAFNNRDEVSFDEEIEFKATNYFSESGSDILIPINAFNRGSIAPRRVRDRKLPFEIKYSYMDIDEVEIKLPPSFELMYVPENKEVETKYGSYSFELSKINETTYLYKRTIEIKEGKYPKEEYSSYRSFRKTIGKYDNSKIILKRK